METRQVIYPVHEVVASIRELLSPLGVVSQIMAIDDIVTSIFEIAAGALSDGDNIAEMLSRYRVPRYQSYGVISQCLQSLNTPLLDVFKQKHDIFTLDCHYRLIGGDLYIDLVPRVPILSPYETYRQSILESVANGDYVPDRIRCEFGL